MHAHKATAYSREKLKAWATSLSILILFLAAKWRAKFHLPTILIAKKKNSDWQFLIQERKPELDGMEKYHCMDSGKGRLKKKLELQLLSLTMLSSTDKNKSSESGGNPNWIDHPL